MSDSKKFCCQACRNYVPLDKVGYVSVSGRKTCEKCSSKAVKNKSQAGATINKNNNDRVTSLIQENTNEYVKRLCVAFSS